MTQSLKRYLSYRYSSFRSHSRQAVKIEPESVNVEFHPMSCSRHCRGIHVWSIVGYIHPSIHISDDHPIVQSQKHRYAPYCEMKEEESSFADGQPLLAASRSTPFANGSLRHHSLLTVFCTSICVLLKMFVCPSTSHRATDFIHEKESWLGLEASFSIIVQDGGTIAGIRMRSYYYQQED